MGLSNLEDFTDLEASFQSIEDTLQKSSVKYKGKFISNILSRKGMWRRFVFLFPTTSYNWLIGIENAKTQLQTAALELLVERTIPGSYLELEHILRGECNNNNYLWSILLWEGMF